MENYIEQIQGMFSDIYDNNKWRTGSGEGSLLPNSLPYINFLENFIRSKQVKTIVDFGCGDWQFSNYVRWGDIQYYGYDIVENVVEQNKKKYGCEKFKFELFNGDFTSLPKADLLICKDVLQHWPIDYIQSFLPILKNYRYSLITNCGEIINNVPHPEDPFAPNSDISVGNFRRLDLRLPPFNVDGVEVFSYTNNTFLSNHTIRWFKKTLLVTSKPE